MIEIQKRCTVQRSRTRENSSGARSRSVDGVSLVGMLRHLGCDLVVRHITASLRLSVVTDGAHSATTATVRRDPAQRCTEHTLRLPKTRSHFVCSEVYFKSDKIKKDETGWGCWPHVRHVNKYGVLVGNSGVPRNFFQGGGGFNKFSWGQRTEMTGIWGL